MNNMSKIPVITIDGPGSSGKGTIGRLLAQKLGWHFLDSGALYRGLALWMLEENVALENTAKIKELAEELDLSFVCLENGTYTVNLNGAPVTQAILSETCGSRASQIAAFPEVRAALLGKQREFRKLPGLVADGRDMGTVIFPDADLKIFLSASVKERAERRYSQLKAQGINVSLTTIEAELKARDDRDSQRQIAPLKPAEDAVLVDTTHSSIAEVIECISDLIREGLGF